MRENIEQNHSCPIPFFAYLLSTISYLQISLCLVGSTLHCHGQLHLLHTSVALVCDDILGTFTNTSSHSWSVLHDTYHVLKVGPDHFQYCVKIMQQAQNA